MDKEKKKYYGQESEKAEQICHYRGCGDAGIYVCYVDRLFYYDIFLRRTTMKKEGKEKNIFFRTITLALVFSLILPFATLLYLFREVSAVNIIALAVNIIAAIIVTICWWKEWKKNRS